MILLIPISDVLLLLLITIEMHISIWLAFTIYVAAVQILAIFFCLCVCFYGLLHCFVDEDEEEENDDDGEIEAAPTAVIPPSPPSSHTSASFCRDSPITGRWSCWQNVDCVSIIRFTISIFIYLALVSAPRVSEKGADIEISWRSQGVGRGVYGYRIQFRSEHGSWNPYG